MKVNAPPNIDPPTKVAAVSVPLTTAALAGARGLAAGAAAAQAGLLAGASGAVDLSPLGRTVAALAAFGFPVVELPAEAESAPQTPGQPPQPDASRQATQQLVRTLAAALSLRGADAAEGGLPPDNEANAPGDAAGPQGGDAAAQRPASTPATAGAQLNAVLCASVTGQTALALQRADHPLLRLELQREPDGRGGFRISRIRIRHQTEDGFLEATAEMSQGVDTGAGPLSVEVACSESWAEAVSGQIGSLHEALDARGLAPAVRARTLG